MRILRKLLKVRNLKIAKVAEFAGYTILELNVNNRLTKNKIQQHAIYSVTTRYLLGIYSVSSG
jgi:hypothetical protein